MVKFYTAFMFKFELDPNKAHCTHKYFGQLTKTEVSDIQNTITRYLAVNGLYRLPAAVFNVEDFFGPNRLIRVLKPNEPTLTEYRKRLFIDLRSTFDKYRDDDFDFTPHVSTEEHAIIQSEFKYYALIASPEGEGNPDVIIKHWDL